MAGWRAGGAQADAGRSPATFNTPLLGDVSREFSRGGVPEGRLPLELPHLLADFSEAGIRKGTEVLESSLEDGVGGPVFWIGGVVNLQLVDASSEIKGPVRAEVEFHLVVGDAKGTGDEPELATAKAVGVGSGPLGPRKLAAAGDTEPNLVSQNLLALDGSNSRVIVFEEVFGDRLGSLQDGGKIKATSKASLREDHAEGTPEGLQVRVVGHVVPQMAAENPILHGWGFLVTDPAHRPVGLDIESITNVVMGAYENVDMRASILGGGDDTNQSREVKFKKGRQAAEVLASLGGCHP